MNLKKHMSDPFVIILIGGFLTACITGITSYASYRAQKKQTQETDSINNAQRQRYEILQTKTGEAVELVKSLTEKNKELDSKIAIQNEKTDLIKKKAEDITQIAVRLDKKAAIQDEKTDLIQQKAEDISKITLQLEETQRELKLFTSESLNYLTGGDSWCDITLVPGADKKASVKLHHVGKYPLSALRITISYSSGMSRKAGNNGPLLKSFRVTKEFDTIISVGPLPKSPTPYDFGTVPFEPDLEEHYYIQYYAQNGVWTQTYAFTYDNFKVRHTSTKVVKDGKVLNEYSY